MPRVCRDSLQAHRDRQEAEGSQSMEVENLIFATAVGTPLEPDKPRRSWYPIRDGAGVYLRFHDPRHTCVTLLLKPGVPAARRTRDRRPSHDRDHDMQCGFGQETRSATTQEKGVWGVRGRSAARTACDALANPGRWLAGVASPSALHAG